MRDIVLYILAVALVSVSTLAALQAGEVYAKANKRIAGQVQTDQGTADELKAWTAKLTQAHT